MSQDMIRRGFSHKSQGGQHRASASATANALRHPWWGLLALLLGAIGAFKATPVLAWVPIDVTLLVAAACLVGVLLYATRTRGVIPSGAKYPALLWCFFIPGAIVESLAGNEPSKVIKLFTLTLLAALVAPFFISTIGAQHWWIRGQVVLAVGAMILIQMFPDVDALARGQAAITGSSTISLGRLIGAGALIAILSATMQRRHRILNIFVGLAAIGSLLSVGNRASVLALLASLVILVVVSAGSHGRRVKALVALAAAVTGLVVAISTGLLDISGRVRTLFLSDLETVLGTNEVRRLLLEKAFRLGLENPLGVGWNGLDKRLDSAGLGENVYPHNILVEVLAEGGWIALIALIVYLIVAARRLAVNATSVRSMALFGLAIYWTAAAMFSEDVNGNRMMWIALGLAFVHLRFDEFMQQPDTPGGTKSPDEMAKG